mgnify:CR=1 FL=1
MTLRTPICDRFGIEHPVFLAGMGEVAFAELVAAVSEAGGYGVLGMAASPPERIREQMRAVRRLTAKPFGVDMLAALPDRVEAAIDVILEEGASCFVAGLGVPAPVTERCHQAGVQVMVVCGKVVHAQRAEDAGCDAVVAQGVWMGTRFIATREARAARIYKERLVAAGDADTEITRAYSGKPMRVLRNAWVDGWRARGDEIQPFPMQMLESARAGVLGFTDDDAADPARTCMPAGQGAGAIRDVPAAAEVVRGVVTDAAAILRRLGALAGPA